MRRNPSKREVIWRNTEKGYGLVHIVLHWTVAAMIALMLPLGLWMTGLDYYDPWYKKGPDLHRSIGVLLGLILLVRIAWRLGSLRPAPVLPPGRELKLARAAHLLLYLLPLLLIVSGYLISTADGRAVDVFGWFEVPATLQGIEGQEDIAGEAHFILAMTLLTLIALHAGAALRHHFILKDDTLRRMYKPQSSPGNEET
jgi:cytochrome b561